MRINNPVMAMVEATQSAIHKDLTEQHHIDNLDVTQFVQTWSDTSLGFGGLGGQAICTADTTIVMGLNSREACVYFGGKFAYRVEKPNEKFMNDMSRKAMEPVKTAQYYERS